MAPTPPAASPSSDGNIATPDNIQGVVPRKNRKAPNQYSTNPNTIRVRQRNASLTPYRLAVERARSNDLKAVSTAWKERSNTETFQSASEVRKKKILEDVEKEVMDRRRRKKIDADSKIYALNQQIRPNDNTANPRSGIIPSNPGPLPAMAPPGYVPFRAEPIPDLMKIPKQTVGPDPEVVAASRSAIANLEDEAPGTDLGSPSTVVNRCVSSEVTNAIADTGVNCSVHTDVTDAITALKEQHEAERKRHDEEMNDLKDVVQSMKNQMEQMTALLQANAPIPARRPALQFDNYNNAHNIGYSPHGAVQQGYNYHTAAQHVLPPLRSAPHVHNYDNSYTDYPAPRTFQPTHSYSDMAEHRYSGRGSFKSVKNYNETDDDLEEHDSNAHGSDRPSQSTEKYDDVDDLFKENDDTTHGPVESVENDDADDDSDGRGYNADEEDEEEYGGDSE
ncbi:hypothetical protein HD806DRAFT_372408 [Xylariaceae sp. AK1471]|nr:hypothetical protein HD806DRAFT_372408 [Xylariaceae sp. AK1471]